MAGLDLPAVQHHNPAPPLPNSAATECWEAPLLTDAGREQEKKTILTQKNSIQHVSFASGK